MPLIGVGDQWEAYEPGYIALLLHPGVQEDPPSTEGRKPKETESVAIDAMMSLTEPSLASAQSLVTERWNMHDAAQRELHTIHYKATQWVTWWQASEVNVWKMWRSKVAHLMQWHGSELRRKHKRALEDIFLEASWTMNRTYYSDAHDRIVLTVPES